MQKVKTSPSIAVCTVSLSPAVYLLSERPELEKDYYPALLDEALKPREGQGCAYRDGARWMLSSPTAPEVCREGASPGVTLTSFQRDLFEQELCGFHIKAASRQPSLENRARGCGVPAVTATSAKGWEQREHWVSSLPWALTTDHIPPSSHSPPTSQPREHHLKEIQLSWESQVAEEKGVACLPAVIKPKAP